MLFRSRMKEWYQITVKEALARLNVTRNGLTEAQAETIREEAGINALEEGAHKKAWQVFLEQFQDLLVVILMVAAVISMMSDNMASTVVILSLIHIS